MSHDQERQLGTPVDEFVKKGQQENITHQLRSVEDGFNAMIRHAIDNFGAKVTLRTDIKNDKPIVVIDAIEFEETNNG